MSDAKPASQLQDAPRRLGGLGELVELLRVEGPTIFLKHALQRYAAPLFSHHYVFEFDLARAAELESSAQLLPRGVTMRIFQGEGEIERLPAILAPGDITFATAEQAMRWGNLAMLAMASDELVAHAWATFKERWISEIRATIVPRNDEVVLYDKRVMPRWRGKGLQYALSVPVMQHLSQRVYRRTLNWVDTLNTRSLKHQRRLGKRKIADIISLPALGVLRVRNVSATGGIIIERRAPR